MCLGSTAMTPAAAAEMAASSTDGFVFFVKPPFLQLYSNYS